MGVKLENQTSITELAMHQKRIWIKCLVQAKMILLFQAM